MATFQATLHDNTIIDVITQGEGPALMLPLRTEPLPKDQADLTRQWGGDPDLGSNLLQQLSKEYKVFAFDYLGHRMQNPAPKSLTPENVASDFLIIAEAVGATSFAYYGYSWLGSCGLQLAVRTDKLWALVMGAFPPLSGPYQEMIVVSNCANKMSLKNQEKKEDEEATPGDWSKVKVQTSNDQTRQFLTYYENLKDFDDTKVDLKNLPRFCFVGEKDEIVYGEEWGGVTVKFAEPLIKGKKELEERGWRVRVLDGLDHSSAEQTSVVLPLLQECLLEAKKASGPK